jgi:ribose 5-phosphate isomerase A
MDLQAAKKAAGRFAASLIEPGMVVGLGSGTTAETFIDALGQKVQAGLSISAVASSRASADRARRLHIPLVDINTVSRIDITIDGADQIDRQKRMIKGGGGAHLREKILAASSSEMVVVIDPSKIVSQLGNTKLPVEILFYGFSSTLARIEASGLTGHLRKGPDSTLFLTDNGNLLFDISLPPALSSPEALHTQLLHIPGVLDTGFFFNLAGRVIVGHPDGTATLSPTLS